MTEITRFAPSPTGPLHLGHAFSAVQAAAHGALMLRIEDIDRSRCRPAHVAGILCDLAWLGLAPAAFLLQSEARPRHRAALDLLRQRGLLYACTCTRGQVEAAAAPHEGETRAYPGTCRGRSPPADMPFAWRLDLAATGLPMVQEWEDLATGRQQGRADAAGDPIIWRKDDWPAYHFACVLDDAAQGVTLVVRGRDLAEATPLQRLLQALLGLPAPRYLHHRLLLNAAGKRLAKRDRAETLASLGALGVRGADLAARLAALPPVGPDLLASAAAAGSVHSLQDQPRKGV
ncbi:tRNA glutamyl-Q(34) synthetase GluQRS [Thermaurantiacus sp.]